MGLMNEATAEPAEPSEAAPPLKDALLTKTREQVDAQVKPALQRDHQALVVAGMKIMYSEETYRMAVQSFNAVAKSQTPPKAAALATITLFAMIWREVRPTEQQQQTMVPAAFSAAIVLLCYVLEYMEQALKIPVTHQVLAQASAATTVGLLKLFGISQQQLTQATQGQAPAGQTPAAPRQVPAAPAQGGA